jgi:hypothetical protein
MAPSGPRDIHEKVRRHLVKLARARIKNFGVIQTIYELNTTPLSSYPFSASTVLHERNRPRASRIDPGMPTFAIT